MRKYLFFLMLFLYENSLLSQQQSTIALYSAVAAKQARAAHYKYLVDTTIKQYLSQPLNDDNEGLWNEALWSMELVVYKNEYSKQKLTVAWAKAKNLSEDFQKNLLEATYSLYPVEFKQPVTQLLKSTTSVAVFLRCAEYLLRADEGTGKAVIAPLIKSKFPNNETIGLQVLQSRLNTWNKPLHMPTLKDILNEDFLKGETVIYSLQRTSRNYAGIVIMRKPDGSFVTNVDGSYFNTAQLARAITGYPFYITNGNTPQGIFRFTGSEVSKLAFIGPTPNLQLKMPYEATPSVFFADSGLINNKWEKDLYRSLLPVSWKNYDGIYESFYAGAMGRYDIIMHGTTIDPSYYKAQTYYPQTPSLGCLCSYEEWNSDGFRIKSNQQQINDVLSSINSTQGFVVVINIDDEKRAVTIDDIKKYLQP